MTKEIFQKSFFVMDKSMCFPAKAYNKYYAEHPDWFEIPDWIKDVLQYADKDTIYCTKEAEPGIRKLFPNSKKVLTLN